MLLFSKMKLRRDVLKKTLWLNTVWRRTTWVVTCTHIFLSHVSILTRDIDIANLSVCLSVRPSLRYVPVPDENGLTYRQFFSPYGSPIIHPNRSIGRRVIAFPIFCNMAAVRHLEYEFCYCNIFTGTLRHLYYPWSHLCGSITTWKFGIDPIFPAGDITIL